MALSDFFSWVYVELKLDAVFYLNFKIRNKFSWRNNGVTSMNTLYDDVQHCCHGFKSWQIDSCYFFQLKLIGS